MIKSQCDSCDKMMNNKRSYCGECYQNMRNENNNLIFTNNELKKSIKLCLDTIAEWEKGIKLK